MGKIGNISIDFVKDWASHLEKLLVSEGQRVNTESDSIEVIAQYYAYERRFPTIERKEIHKAKGFSCPAAHAKGLSLIESKLVSGESVRAHLNTTSIDLKKRDDLLVEWGIHHLHLGTIPHSRDSRFVERTGPLLYCRITKSDAYFIGVKPHGQWTNQNLIQILHDNWPSSISQYRLNNVTELAIPVDQSDRAQLRQGNVNSFVELAPGVVYGSLGGGFTSSGLPTTAMLLANQATDWLKRKQSVVIQSKEEWAQEAEFPQGDFNFRLIWKDGVAYALDERQKLSIKLGKPC